MTEQKPKKKTWAKEGIEVDGPLESDPRISKNQILQDHEKAKKWDMIEEGHPHFCPELIKITEENQQLKFRLADEQDEVNRLNGEIFKLKQLKKGLGNFIKKLKDRHESKTINAWAVSELEKIHKGEKE